MEGNEGRIRLENLPDLVADQIVDALNIHLGDQPCLHTIDDGEFGITLLLCFKQARVLDAMLYLFAARFDAAQAASATAILVGTALSPLTLALLLRLLCESSADSCHTLVQTQ